MPIYMSDREAVHYNRVGVAVVMVISTMHEKSSTDLHNAQNYLVNYISHNYHD